MSMVENPMESSFGVYPVRIPDSNLLYLPKQARQHVQDSDSVFVIGKEGYLAIYPRKIYEKERKKILLGRSERDIYSCHSDIKFRENGFVYIPNLLRKFLSIDNEAVVFNVGKVIEIWDRKRWEVEQNKGELPRRIFFDFGYEPFIIFSNDVLEEHTEKSWEEKVSKVMTDINPNSKKGRRIQRYLFPKAQDFDNLFELIDYCYSDE